MFTPNAVTIVDLLKKDVQLIVPKYQRGYAWKLANAEDFCLDISEATEPTETLFLGTCIFKVSDSQGKLYEIVDGQQRLVTATLFLAVCRLRARVLGDEKLEASIRAFTSFRDNFGAYMGPKIQASHTIREAFEYALSDDWDGSFPKRIGDLSIRKQASLISPIVGKFRSFVDEVAPNVERLKLLLDAVYRSTFIRIDVADEIDALAIFERTNARGQDLEIADLLKNHLYQHMGPALDEHWQLIQTNGDSQLLRMIKLFVVAENGYVPKRSVYRVLKGRIGGDGAENVTRRLGDFSAFFSAVYRQGSREQLHGSLEAVGATAVTGPERIFDEIAHRLFALRWMQISQHIPAVYAAVLAMTRTSASYRPVLNLVAALERFHFVNTRICDRIGNEVEKIYADFCLNCSKTSDLNAEVVRLTELLRSRLRSEDEFCAAFASDVSYLSSEKGLLSYVFDRLENAERRFDEWEPIFDTGDLEWTRKKYEIEHLLSQNPRPPLSAEEQEVVHEIGNLLIVPNATNNRLSNRPVSEKIGILQTNPISRFVIVRNFLNQWAALPAKRWSAPEIRARTQDLGKHFYDIARKL